MTAKTIAGVPEPVEGRADAERIVDGMGICFPGGMSPGDKIAVRAPSGNLLDISLGGVRRDGCPAVWYAPHPVFRHWLGWLEGQGETWILRMEPFHQDMMESDEFAALTRY